MQYSKTLSLKCPHCDTKCQFIAVEEGHNKCLVDYKHYIPYFCTNCRGVIVTRWTASECSPKYFRDCPSSYRQELDVYFPIIGDWEPRVKLHLITNENVRNDFNEAIKCYNNGFFNACMIMTRRAIQQEMIINKSSGKNLYEQIKSMGVSDKLKSLLHKVKNFGNNGAHPDFCLFDEEGHEITNKHEFAKLSLEFLDRYFADEYEIDSIIKSAPKSEKELSKV